jgi:putative NADPH-quinone reductase
MPKDVLAQQAKVAAADALAFIAPIHFCSFPSILKGWIDRVWTLDFAYGLTSAGWHGDVNGRIPLLHDKRVLIMTSTIFNKDAYDAGIRDAIGKVLDEWSFRYPGIEDTEHVYFYAATAATAELVEQYPAGLRPRPALRPASSGHIGERLGPGPASGGDHDRRIAGTTPPERGHVDATLRIAAADRAVGGLGRLAG